MAQAVPVPHREEFYGSDDVVRRYARQSLLQLPEQAIFERIGPSLADSELLDLGVGGGRTTIALAQRCRRYLGADVAAPMVAACRERFSELLKNPEIRFEVADARRMPFAAASFDIVLFSFNGIDLVGADARATALAECRRVLRPGGHLVYSSHNLNWMDSRRGIRWKGLRDFVKTQRFWSQMRRINRSEWPIAERAWIELLDPLAGGSNYYIRPQELVRQTLEQGFEELQLYDLRGQRIDDPQQRARLMDPWVYVHARASR
ncbi:class I SAM-dependent methyltransferase [uncultured Sphaerotilus sp.]|uniref:class I SAM-dependent methyltransferase n=1 Tax=uncultured Sphaerotilus sp. TaxID=474984 RepID=UPI0030CA4061